jgi:hypothetical protein
VFKILLISFDFTIESSVVKLNVHFLTALLSTLCFFCFKRLKVNSKENHLEDESWPHISKKREAALILIGIANSKHFF